MIVDLALCLNGRVGLSLRAIPEVHYSLRNDIGDKLPLMSLDFEFHIVGEALVLERVPPPRLRLAYSRGLWC